MHTFPNLRSITLIPPSSPFLWPVRTQKGRREVAEQRRIKSAGREGTEGDGGEGDKG